MRLDLEHLGLQLFWQWRDGRVRTRAHRRLSIHRGRICEPTWHAWCQCLGTIDVTWQDLDRHRVLVRARGLELTIAAETMPRPVRLLDALLLVEQLIRAWSWSRAD